jgi:hypothetical protein
MSRGRLRSLPEEIDLKGSLEAGTDWRIEVTRGMRAPIVNGEVTLVPCWRADCSVRTDKRWNFLVTIIDETIAGLFKQLAALGEEDSPVRVTR